MTNLSPRPRRTPEQLRSHRWFGPDDLRSFGHRSRAKQMGYATEDFAGKPVIGILNTWSDLNTCHTHFRDRAQEVKRGVWQAGGFPVELPIMSLSEMFMKPTSMFYRNLVAMEVEETLRCYPLDGAVLMGGCDKTTPALLMGAITMNLPSIYLPAGAMTKGNWRGTTLGSGSDVWKYWDERRAGNLSCDAWAELEDGIARGPGTCMTMGTAATMMSIAEALGMSLPNASSIPAAHAEHARMATRCGRRIVEMVWEDLRPKDILTKQSFENAIIADMALGGSTNAIVHVLAMARRAGAEITLEDFDRLSLTTPLVANLRPSGEYLMEDFHDAGGLCALLERIRGLLFTEALTVTGKSIGENIAGAEVYEEKVIRPLDQPLADQGGTFVLRGNLCPNGAVIKPAAADPRLQCHTGPALVFDTYAELKQNIDREDLEVTPDTVLVLRNAGPLGGPGMPEWGMLPIPKKLLKQGIRDMVRISDARMSGTSYGTCVLHIAPESAVGGPLALVHTGDLIALDVAGRRLELLVDEDELSTRRAAWTAPPPRYHRGYGRLLLDEITLADEGCDFKFLASAGETPEPDIF